MIQKHNQELIAQRFKAAVSRQVSSLSKTEVKGICFRECIEI